MYLGIDLGTSSVKSLLIDEDGRVLRSASVSLQVQRPRPTWSEQDPRQWWMATQQSLSALSEQGPLKALKGIGLSGQMHGATVLDGAGEPLRPAILWNDGRSAEQCDWLEQRVPDSSRITGNRIMPGFTAPKLVWLAEHEPSTFKATRMVLLPKDYIRFRLTGDYASDMSDAAGTMWLDVGRRDYSDTMLSACGLDRARMPRLFEGPQITGTLSAEWASHFNCPRVPVVAGAGDNAAGALGVGIVAPGEAMISLGTSGTYFVVTDAFRQNAGQAVHSFCHALPGKWHVMSVILSAASCLSWLRDVTGAESVEQLLREAEASKEGAPGLYFLPYLAGERTPHNDPAAVGVFYGLSHAVQRGDLARAVLEGVAFAMGDGAEALHQATPPPSAIFAIGGGARSPLWTQMLCDVLNLPLAYVEGSEVGPALGAAQLARHAVQASDPVRAFPRPSVLREHEPKPDRANQIADRRRVFRDLYKRLSIPGGVASNAGPAAIK